MASRQSQMQQRPWEVAWCGVWCVLGKGPLPWQLSRVLRHEKGFAWSKEEEAAAWYFKQRTQACVEGPTSPDVLGIREDV